MHAWTNRPVWPQGVEIERPKDTPKVPDTLNWDYAGPLSEMVFMGDLAVRYPGRKLLWDGEKMEATNDKDANTHVRQAHRRGWSL